MGPRVGSNLVLAVTATAVALPLAALLRARAMAHYVESETYEDVYYLPPPDALPWVSLGWDRALADLLWTRALVYFGDEMVHGGAVAHVFDYADAMLRLDPDFRAVYDWVATAGLYRPQDVSQADALQTIEILRRGRERFPDDGELAWKLGAALAFEIPSLIDDPGERSAYRAEAAEHLIDAARLGAGPEWLALTNAAILERIGRAQAAADHLEEMYAMSTDERTRAELAGAIAQLRSAAHAEALVEANREEEERRARELPYLSPDLYFLVGPRPVVPWAEIYRDGFATDAVDGLGALDVLVEAPPDHTEPGASPEGTRAYTPPRRAP